LVVVALAVEIMEVVAVLVVILPALHLLFQAHIMELL
jgi:hypothetical protein